MAGEDTSKEGAAAGNGTGQGAESEAPQTVSAEAFQKLQEQNQRLKGQLTDIEKKYSTFSSMYKDIDPDEIRELRKRTEEAERKAAEKDPAKMEELFERKLKKFRDEVESEKSSLTAELEKLRKTNKTLAVTDRVMSEISHLFNKDALRFIKREVEELCDLDEDGTILIKDENGEPMFRNGKYLGVKDFGEMLAERYPSLAAAVGTGGAKDVTPGHKVAQRGRDYSKISFEEFAGLPNQGEVWKNHLTPEQKLQFAGRMKIGGQQN